MKSFKVDLSTTERLAARALAASRAARDALVLVAESGIHSRADVERVAGCGARGVLVGESLMRGKDIGAKVRELIGAAGVA